MNEKNFLLHKLQSEVINMKQCAFIFLLAIPFILLLSFAASFSVAQDIYIKTPADYEGPFYPVIRQQDEDSDLLHVAGQSEPARGNVLNLSGVVLNTRGEPQKSLTVEIWQTDPLGRYKDPRDNTPGKRDPHFQYWGKAITAKDGTFIFKTLVPGGYAPRPAHIHFKVWKAEQLLLTSQIYIKNHPDRKEPFPAKSFASDLQIIELKPTKPNEFKGFFQIII